MRQQRAHLFFEAHCLPESRGWRELRGKRFRYRIVNVEHNFSPKHARHESGEDEKVRQVVSMNDIELALDQELEACERTREQKPEVGREVHGLAFTLVFKRAQL